MLAQPQQHMRSNPPITHQTPEMKVRQSMIMLGVPIDNLTMDETLNRIEQFIQLGRDTGKTHQIATVNTDFLIKAMGDDHLRSILQSSAMCTADGMPLVWGSKMLGVPLKERVAGSDMVPFFAERAAKKGYSLYFLGAAPEVARRATDILKENNPGLNIVGMASPYWKPDEEMDPAIIADIKAAKPDVLFVAFGNPKQELWIEKYGKEVGVPVMMGIGATLDFIAGKTQRAPRWMQKTGLEWAMRLIQEPKRLWKRYAVGMLVFAPQLLRQWWTMRNQNHDAQLLKISSQKMGDLTTITLQGRVDITSYRIVYREGQTAITARPRLIINMAQVDRLDCLGIATLMELAKQTRDAGGDLRLISLPDKLYRLFSQIGILGFFRLEDTGEYANGWLTDRLVGRRA